MDKVVVVTGASAGIGAALARQLAARGAKVVLAARRAEELDAVAKEIGEGALAVVADVTRRGDVERLAQAAIDRFGRVDVWVNNAGRGISRSVGDLTDEDLDAMWTINMKSVVYGIQAVLPHFKARNAGQIVNISSGLSRFPGAPVRAAYGAVKAAVNLLTASLRVELKATHPGIHVTLVLPGVVATEFGLNSMGVGIVDNRKLPGAQPVDDAARAIVDVIENPRPEAYTSAFIADAIARYQREPVVVEAEFASRQRLPRPGAAIDAPSALRRSSPRPGRRSTRTGPPGATRPLVSSARRAWRRPEGIPRRAHPPAVAPPSHSRYRFAGAPVAAPVAGQTACFLAQESPATGAT